jgi:hypothetical protein
MSTGGPNAVVEAMALKVGAGTPPREDALSDGRVRDIPDLRRETPPLATGLGATASGPVIPLRCLRIARL